MTVRRSAPCLFGRLLLPALLIAGCAQPDVPQLGQVTGIVTLNGEPLPHARVCFTPDTGRPSVGLTGASGRYWLTYYLAPESRLSFDRLAAGGDGEDPEAAPM